MQNFPKNWWLNLKGNKSSCLQSEWLSQHIKRKDFTHSGHVSHCLLPCLVVSWYSAAPQAAGQIKLFLKVILVLMWQKVKKKTFHTWGKFWLKSLSFFFRNVFLCAISLKDHQQQFKCSILHVLVVLGADYFLQATFLSCQVVNCIHQVQIGLWLEKLEGKAELEVGNLLVSELCAFKEIIDS